MAVLSLAACGGPDPRAGAWRLEVELRDRLYFGEMVLGPDLTGTFRLGQAEGAASLVPEARGCALRLVSGGAVLEVRTSNCTPTIVAGAAAGWLGGGAFWAYR